MKKKLSPSSTFTALIREYHEHTGYTILTNNTVPKPFLFLAESKVQPEFRVAICFVHEGKTVTGDHLSFLLERSQDLDVSQVRLFTASEFDPELYPKALQNCVSIIDANEVDRVLAMDPVVPGEKISHIPKPKKQAPPPLPKKFLRK